MFITKSKSALALLIGVAISNIANAETPAQPQPIVADSVARVSSSSDTVETHSGFLYAKAYFFANYQKFSRQCERLRINAFWSSKAAFKSDENEGFCEGFSSRVARYTMGSVTIENREAECVDGSCIYEESKVSPEDCVRSFILDRIAISQNTPVSITGFGRSKTKSFLGHDFGDNRYGFVARDYKQNKFTGFAVVNIVQYDVVDASTGKTINSFYECAPKAKSAAFVLRNLGKDVIDHLGTDD